MNREELVEKIKRFDKLSTQRKFTKQEFREMEGYLKQIRPTWTGCEYCPAQIHFGQTILKTELNNLNRQLTLMDLDNAELQSTISTDLSETAEVAVEASVEELPPVPVGDVVITSECKKCRKKRQIKG